MNRQTSAGSAPAQYRSYNLNLLLIAAFTLINVVLVLCKADTYFLFSAYLPYWLVAFFAITTGYFPVEDITTELLPSGVFVAAVVFALIIIAVYAILWFFSRKSYIPLVVGAVLMGVDTVAMFLLTGIDVSMLIDYIFHGVVLYCLIRGILIGRRLQEQGVDLSVAVSAPSADKANDSFYAPSVTSDANAADNAADGNTDNASAETTADAAFTADHITAANADNAADGNTDNTPAETTADAAFTADHITTENADNAADGNTDNTPADNHSDETNV